ncbi:hypothetical protein DDZ13_08485 [Coraliomargarita sinensis]|uniref:Lipocalin-like domain-containing protein n=1 Tax=Coraliomargarita sinensis TaxID=2174842 RepID=A0A317ZIE4_9BACT|nr:hypothetical protein [Coraliomargarita sinensis]PXA04067.1 hypothetical protein DDZ13_08485 [Coraliomargarita sinensis]
MRFDLNKYSLGGFLTALVFLLCTACSQQKETQISGIWRSEDALDAKNLVIEFVPNGTGQVFSGSIIGFPTDAEFEWRAQGDEVFIETTTEPVVSQTMLLLDNTDQSLEVEVNRTKFTLVRVDDIIDGEMMESLP